MTLPKCSRPPRRSAACWPSATYGQKEPGVHEYEIDGRASADLRRPLFGIAAKRNWPILSMVSSELSLEDVFLRLTGSTYLSDNADRKFGKDGDRR